MQQTRLTPQKQQQSPGEIRGFILYEPTLRIYLDTNLWNLALDEAVEPVELLYRLDQRGHTLVLGLHAFYEALRTFRSGTPEAIARGKQLFACIDSFFKAGMRCVVKDTFECLVSEMYSLKGVDGTSKFLDYENYTTIESEVARLALGEIKPDWFGHIDQQVSESRLSRSLLQTRLDKDSRLRGRLRGVPSESLSKWIGAESRGQVGRFLLTDHLARHFPEVARQELEEYSEALLADERHFVAHGLTRADLYYTWRCAHRGSNPRDLSDDMYHILNSSYCDIYATNEAGQNNYIQYILRSGTRMVCYGRGEGLADWLLCLR